MIWHLGVVGGRSNQYKCFTGAGGAELAVEKILVIWKHFGYAIQLPLFPDEPVKEWKAYVGRRIVRRMMLLREDEDESTQSQIK